MNDLKKAVVLTLVALVFKVALYLSFYERIVISSDQSQNIALARKLAAGDFYGVLDTYWTPFYPILIGLVSVFTDSLLLPSAIVSIIAGSLAVTCTYYLVRQSYGAREAVTAALLAVFYPHLNNSILDFGSENVYLLLMIGALIAGWEGLNKKSPQLYFLTGILLGLAYLTRPEAIGYIALFSIFAFAGDFRHRKTISSASVAQLAALIFGFLILAVPYILYLQGETGVLTISGKAGVNFASGEFREDPAAAAMPMPFESKSALLLVIKTFLENLIDVQISFSVLLPWLMAVFVALGLFGSKWDRARFKRETYLGFFCAFTVICYALTVTQTRYFYVLLPIFFGWIALGIRSLGQWFYDSANGGVPEKYFIIFNRNFFAGACLVFIFVYLFPINYFMRSEESLWKANAYEERNAGLWIKENGKKNPLIFSARRTPALYAEGEKLFLTTTGIEETIAEAVNHQVDYIVLGKRTLKQKSFAKGVEMLEKREDFEIIYHKNEYPGYEILIFGRK